MLFLFFYDRNDPELIQDIVDKIKKKLDALRPRDVEGGKRWKRCHESPKMVECIKSFCSIILFLCFFLVGYLIYRIFDDSFKARIPPWARCQLYGLCLDEVKIDRNEN